MMQENTPNPYAVSSNGSAAIYAEETERQGFIRRTYAHLALAVAALIALETVLFTVVPAATMNQLVASMTGMGWIVVLIGFMAVSWVARSWASSDTSIGMQYAGLSLYVVAQAVLFLPLLYFAIRIDPKLPVLAAAITGASFAGLTVFVFATGVDLSSWGKYLFVGGLVAIVVVFAGVLFGFSLGVWFCGAMIALACCYILYDTSNILHHYQTSQYVAASLALFASVALLFWYILQFMMNASND